MKRVKCFCLPLLNKKIGKGIKILNHNYDCVFKILDIVFRSFYRMMDDDLAYYDLECFSWCLIHLLGHPLL